MLGVIFSIFAYQKMVQIITYNVEKTHIQALNHTKSIMEEKLKQVDNLIFQLSCNSKVKRLLMSDSTQKEAIYQIREVSEEITPYLTKNLEFLVYFKGIGTIISPQGCFTKLDIVYGESLNYKDMTYENFLNQVLNKRHPKDFYPTASTTINGKKGNRMMCIQSLPLESGENFGGNMLYFFEEKIMNQLLENSYPTDEAWAFVSDKKGQVLCAMGKNYEHLNISIPSNNKEGNMLVDYEGGKLLVTYTISNYNGWRYFVVMPQNVFLAQINQLKRTSLFILLIYLGIGLIGAFSLTKVQMRPLIDVVEVLRSKLGISSSAQDDEFKILKRYFGMLMANNENLVTELDHHKPIIREKLITGLLNGEFSKEEEIITYMNDNGLDCSMGDCFCVVIVEADIYANELHKQIETADQAFDIIIDTLRAVINNNSYVMPYKKDTLYILFCGEAMTTEEFREYINKRLKKIVETLICYYNISIYCSCGDIVSARTEIVDSCSHAEECSMIKPLTNEKVIHWFDENKQDLRQFIFYSMEIEKQLMSALGAGDTQKILKIFQLLHVENFVNRQLNRYQTKQLMYELKGTLYKSMVNIHYKDNSEKNNSLNDIEAHIESINIREQFDYFTSLFVKITEEVALHKRSHNQQLKEAIVSYVEINYDSNQISLKHVADVFKISETYLSQFFKESMGVNFINYIESKRIAKAIELLAKKDKKINDVAFDVGYNSSHAFRRAFKKQTGCVPSQFR